MQRSIPVEDDSQWEEALQAWDARGDLAEAERAADLFEELAELEHDSPHAWAWVARASYYTGDYQKRDRDRAKLYKRGWKAGRRALELDPDHIGGLFWTAVCLAADADLANMLSRATYVPELLRYMKQVWERDPTYLYRGPARLLGQAIVRQPGLVSKFLPVVIPQLGSDTALQQLRLAIEEGPPVVLNYQTLGQLSHALSKDRETPRQMLEALDSIDLDAAEDFAPENRRDLPRAREILRSLR